MSGTLYDECWWNLTTGFTGPYLTDIELYTLRPGCMKSTTTGFAVCDIANGYIKPSDVSATSTGTYNGHCIPVCYMKGYQNDGTAAPGPATKEDKCFIPDIGADFTFAEFTDTALA